MSGAASGLAAREIARVVLDPRAVTQFRHHFNIEQGALLQTLRLHQLAGLAQFLEAQFQIHLDLIDGIQDDIARRGVVSSRVDGQSRHPSQHRTGQRIKPGKGIDLVVKQLHAHRLALRLRRKDIDDLPRTR